MAELSEEDTRVRKLGALPGAEPKSPDEEFHESIRHHLLYTCVKDARDATAHDLYRAMALSVRDRLVLRWLATQRTYAATDAKAVYYLSSEFLTGRSLGLCLLNLGLYSASEQVAAEFGVDFGEVLDSEGDPGPWPACRLLHGLARDAGAAGHGLRPPL